MIVSTYQAVSGAAGEKKGINDQRTDTRAALLIRFSPTQSHLT